MTEKKDETAKAKKSDAEPMDDPDGAASYSQSYLDSEKAMVEAEQRMSQLDVT